MIESEALKAFTSLILVYSHDTFTMALIFRGDVLSYSCLENSSINSNLPSLYAMTQCVFLYGI